MSKHTVSIIRVLLSILCIEYTWVFVILEYELVVWIREHISICMFVYHTLASRVVCPSYEHTNTTPEYS